MRSPLNSSCNQHRLLFSTSARSSINKHVHRDICYEIVMRVRKLTSKFKQDLNWDQFSNELGSLCDIAVDALQQSDMWLLSPDLSESSSSKSSKSSRQQQKRKAPTEQRHQPAGPDEQAFGAGRGMKSCEDAPRLSRPKGRSLGDLSQEWGIPKDIDPAEYYSEQESSIKSMLLEDFKKWYYSSNIADA